MMYFLKRFTGLVHFVPCRCSKLLLIVAAAVLTSACSSSDDSDQPPPGPPPSFALDGFSSPVTLVEGNQALEVPVSISRIGGFESDIELQVTPSFLAENPSLVVSLDPSTLQSAESTAQLSLAYSLSVSPQQPKSLVVPIQATSGGITEETSLTLEISPTSAPDVYLLIGQSNMVGDSEAGALRNQPGQPDAPDPRIRQLNVTNNTDATFPTLESFSDPANNAGNPVIITAADPLHELLPSGQQNKTGDKVGLGLSFAKAALSDTTSTILLVPAAWSGTGFCNGLNDLAGWNVEPRENERMRGTGLYLRAVARTNLALQQSGGVLRGILWHQGESDEFNAACANAYAQNLQAMVRALRTDIVEDARGNTARGPEADVPFVLGTLSRGSDSRGDFFIQSAEQQTIDNAHRMVESNIPNSAFSDHQDLVPPDFPCGAISCIHFGAAAYREMGNRYYLALRDILAR